MLETMFQDNKTFISEENNGHGGHLGHVTNIPNHKFRSLATWMLYM